LVFTRPSALLLVLATQAGFAYFVPLSVTTDATAHGTAGIDLITGLTVRYHTTGMQPTVQTQDVLIGGQPGLELFAVIATCVVLAWIVVILSRIIPTALTIKEKPSQGGHTGTAIVFEGIRIIRFIVTFAIAASFGMVCAGLFRAVAFAPADPAIHEFPRPGLALVSI